MKRNLLYTSVVALFAIIVVACNTNPMANQQAPVSDTVGLAQFNEWKAMEAQAVIAKQQQVAYAASRRSAPAKTYSMNSESTNEAKVETKKKGWSKSAKYAVIGATGGGILGAVINKKDPVKGGIIGAVVLGGGGYVLGRSQDKKDGRF
jgi:uncharacterized membrane protein YeiH